MGANLYTQPATVVIPQGDGAKVVLVPQGSPGAAGQAAAIDFMMEFENFTAGASAKMPGALARAFPATAAASIAYTETPPINSPVTIELTDNGTPFGTATWGIGETFGVCAWTGAAPYVARDVPGAILPTPLDSAFTQFAITFAS